MKPEGILWETKPNRASFDILLGFILFSPTYRFAGIWNAIYLAYSNKKITIIRENQRYEKNNYFFNPVCRTSFRQ